MMRKGWLHFLLAFLLIGTGIVLMLENLGVIDKTLYISWGMILAAILMLTGLKLWWDRLAGHGGSWMFGSFFTIYGLLVLLGEIGVIIFTFSDVLKLWPLLFIYIGFGMFLGGSRKRFRVNVDTEDLSGSSFEKKHNNKKMHTVIGDHQYNAENWKVEPMQLWNAVGDYHFDFTKAFIPEKDTPISVKGWAGDIKMLMPENLDYRIEAFVKAGSINLLGKTSDGINRSTTFETPGYQDATRRLTIDIDLKAGDVRVDKV